MSTATSHAEEVHTHAHDHEHEHHELNFWTKYIFSTDHKTIAKQYLISGIIWAFIGGSLSIIFRLQLGFPEMQLDWLRPILGEWIDEGGKLDKEFYLALVTMHGTIMVFFVLTAGLSGTFSNFLIPLQIGARDMASGFINMLSYWFFFLSSMIMFASLFIETGPASGGWVIYPPLSALPQAMPGSGLGMTMWLTAMTFFIVSSLMGGINYICTVINLRTRGMTFTKMPLTIWSFFFTAVLGLLSFPVLLSAALLLIFDRSFGTSFYLSEIYIQGQALPNMGGSPILYQHLTGMNPFLGSVFMFLTLIIAVPSAVKAFNYITTLWKGNLIFTPAMLFSIGLVSLFISGGVTGIILGNSALDINLHDTYFVVAHFHLVMGAASFFGLMAGVYHWFPKMFGRMMNKTLGYIHFWFTFVGVYMVFFPMHYIGIAGFPRRYYSFTAVGNDGAAAFTNMNAFISIAAIITFSAQAIFAWNFFYSIFKGKKAPQNPWNSTTLEWTTPIEPGHGNWEGEIPAVYRWPYDYSKPGSDVDFIPQNVPFSATKSSNLPEEDAEIAREKDIDGLLGAQNESYNR